MEGRNNTTFERTSSEISTTSRRSGTVRSRSRKQSLVTPTSAKSLTSFPSLSPDSSPGPTENGDFPTGLPPLPTVFVGKLLHKLADIMTGRSPVQMPLLLSSASNVSQLWLTSPDSTPKLQRKASSKSPSIVETLITSTPSFRGRAALFEDSPKGNTKKIAGALHLASDEHIKGIVTKSGPIALVRQLAQDLAQRDAEMVTFRRRAEEREHELKRMLREVEVSNQDIETRLHRLESRVNAIPKADAQSDGMNSKAKRMASTRQISSVTGGIDEMMGEAMNEELRLSSEMDEGYLDSLEQQDKQATIRAGALNRKSTSSSASSKQQTASITTRGWKDFLWSANGTSRKNSRASSIISDTHDDAEAALTRVANKASNRRRGLDEDLFSPPERTITSQSAISDTQARISSASITSWTTKLFAGNSKAQNTIRGRSATTGSRPGTASRADSNVPPLPSNSARAALMKVSNIGQDNNKTARKEVKPLTLTGGNIPRTLSQPANPQLAGSPRQADSAPNLGPVEMDTILPPDTRPPTQTQITNNNQNSEYLTDRFGFIYDQRRRRKQAEATKHARGKPSTASVEMLSSGRDSTKAMSDDDDSVHLSVGSPQRPETPLSMEERLEKKPAKRWQDYLKAATAPTELLSHTPSARRIDTVAADSPSAKRSPGFHDARGLPSTSLNPQPSASTVTARNAEIAKPSDNAGAHQPALTNSEAEPVRLLLAQLTELHDSLQKEKTIKWNEFLRKVRAERAKGETAASNLRSQAAAMPEMTLTDGSLIGVAVLGNKGKVGRAKWKEFKQLVLAGIPVSYRAKIWAECSGASSLRVPGYYDDLIHNGTDDPIILSQINMDIHRTLTDNIYFRGGPGVGKLHEVLMAYARRNPDVGYCQGMNLIAASLLLIMPTAEDAFWVLSVFIYVIVTTLFYTTSLLASRADQHVLRQYVSDILPKLSAHLDSLGIELEALTFQWFLSVFTSCLSAEALFRIWDVVLCNNNGSTFLFQIALALLKLNEDALLKCDNAARVYAYIGGEMTEWGVSIDGLVGGSEALKDVVRRAEVDERRRVAMEEDGKANGLETPERKSSGAVGEGGLSALEPRPVEESE